MKKTVLAVIMILLLLVSNALAEQVVKVGLEPLPPLTNDDGTGATIDILRAIEEVSDFRFDITVVPFSRAEKWTQDGTVDALAQFDTTLPKELIYWDLYAPCLKWGVKVHPAVFYVDDKVIEIFREIALKGAEPPADFKVGVTVGNADFWSEYAKLPRKMFVEGEGVNLVKMLKAGRISAIYNSDAAAALEIKQAGVKGIKFERYPPDLFMNFSIAFKNDERGRALRDQVDEASTKIDMEKILTKWSEYLGLPQSGTIE